MPFRPDLLRLMEPGNFIDRLNRLERLVRQVEARAGVFLRGVPPHTHPADQMEVFDDSASPADVEQANATGTAVFAARRDHAHQVDYTLAPSWTGQHTFSVSPSVMGLSASGERIQDVADPQASTDAVTRGWVSGSYGRRWTEPFAMGGSVAASGDYLGWLGLDALAAAESAPPAIVAGSVIGLSVRASVGPGSGSAELYRVYVGAASTGASITLAGTATCQWANVTGETFSASQGIGVRREYDAGSPWASASDIRISIWLEQS